MASEHSSNTFNLVYGEPSSVKLKTDDSIKLSFSFHYATRHFLTGQKLDSGPSKPWKVTQKMVSGHTASPELEFCLVGYWQEIFLLKGSRLPAAPTLSASLLLSPAF